MGRIFLPARPIPRVLLALCYLCSSLPILAHQDEQEAGQVAADIANQLFATARSFESRGEHLTALRGYDAALRLLPSHPPFLHARKRIVAAAVGSVHVAPAAGEGHGQGTSQRMLVWRPPADKIISGDPTMMGSANDQTKAFFEWKGLPTHDWGGSRCCGFSHEGRGSKVTTVLGLTCLSPLFVEAHNAAQALLIGGSPPPIPTGSRVASCGGGCGVDVPEAPESLAAARQRAGGGVRWEGEVLGQRVVLRRGEGLDEAVRQIAMR